MRRTQRRTFMDTWTNENLRPDVASPALSLLDSAGRQAAPELVDLFTDENELLKTFYLLLFTFFILYHILRTWLCPGSFKILRTFLRFDTRLLTFLEWLNIICIAQAFKVLLVFDFVFICEPGIILTFLEWVFLIVLILYTIACAQSSSLDLQ